MFQAAVRNKQMRGVLKMALSSLYSEDKTYKNDDLKNWNIKVTKKISELWGLNVYPDDLSIVTWNNKRFSKYIYKYTNTEEPYETKLAGRSSDNKKNQICLMYSPGGQIEGNIGYGVSKFPSDINDRRFVCNYDYKKICFLL